MDRLPPSHAYELIFEHPITRWSVSVEDDGRVAYVFLMEPAEDDVRCQAWLLNHAAAPDAPDLHSTSYSLVEANLACWLCSEAAPGLWLDPRSFWVHWPEDLETVEAWVFSGDRLVAVLRDGATPGWSYMAKDGPLARALTNPPADALKMAASHAGGEPSRPASGLRWLREFVLAWRRR